MGISSLPRAFTKLVRPVMAFLRSFGLRLLIFIDDILVMGESYQSTACDVQDVLTLLTWLGFVISTKEQVKLVPGQRQVWCGALICSLTMRFMLPQSKVGKLQRTCRQAISKTQRRVPLTLRAWASVLGVCRSTSFAVLPANLWSQPLRRFIAPFVRPGKHHPCWNQKLPFPPAEVLMGLQRFAGSELLQFNGRPVVPSPPQVLMDSDASGFGGGGVMTEPLQLEARWHWLPSEAAHHINWKELATVQMLLQSFDLEVPGIVFHQVFQNRSDNTVACSYVSKMGGRVPFLSFTAEALWYYLLARGSELRMQFLPGLQNVDADQASRWRVSAQEYQLRPDLFRGLHQRWGPFEVDAFASRANAQLPQFWSRYPEPSAQAVDALQQRWDKCLYLAPPFGLLSRVLQEVRSQRVNDCTLLAPLWPTQSWWATLLSMAVDFSVLGRAQEIYVHPTKRMPMSLRGPHARSFLVVAWRLCGVSWQPRDSVSRLSSELFAASREARAIL